MAFLKLIRKIHWIIQDYHLSTHKLEQAEKGLTAWAVAIVIIRYLVNCWETLERMLRGETLQALAMTEFNFLHGLITWSVVPFLVTFSSGTGKGLDFRKMMHYPLSGNRLFLITITRITVMPVFWVLIFFSVFSFIPILFAPSPAAGLSAGLLFIVLCIFLSLFVESLGNFISTNNTFYLVVLRLFLIFLIASNPTFFWKDGNVQLSLLGSRFLLAGWGSAPGVLQQTAPWFPWNWVSGAAGGNLFFLIPFTPVAAGLLLLLRGLFEIRWKSRFLLNLSVVRGKKRLRSRTSGSKYYSFLKKEFVQRAGSSEYIMAVFLTGFLIFYIFTSPSNIYNTSRIFICLIFLIISPVAFNTFGIDGTAFDRYRLFPVGAVEIIKKKNLSYYLLMTILIVPILVFLAWRLPFIALNLLVMSVIVMLLYTSWGNITSIIGPAPQKKGREQGGGLLSLLFALCLWIGLYYLFHELKEIYAWLGFIVNVLLLIISGFVYKRVLRKAGELFYKNGERMSDILVE